MEQCDPKSHTEKPQAVEKRNGLNLERVKPVRLNHVSATASASFGQPKVARLTGSPSP